MKVTRVTPPQEGFSLQSTNNAESSPSKDSAKPAEPKNTSTFKSCLKLTGWFGIGIVRWFVYITAAACPLIMTTPGNKALNWAIKTSGVLPKKDSNEQEKDYQSELNADRFFENFPGFNKIMSVASKAGINSKTLDKNDGIILNSEEEIQDFISLLESKKKGNDPDIEEALILLRDYKQIHKLTFGANGLDLKWISEESSLNWQMKTILRSKIGSITNEDIQKLKGMVQILEYNLDKDNFYINYGVRFDEHAPIKPLSIPYKSLNLPKDYNPVNPSEPLLVSVANYTFDKLTNEDPECVAGCVSSSPITISVNDYSNHLVINTGALTDSDLEKILTQSNKKLIPVARFSTKDKLVDAINYIATAKENHEAPSDSIYFIKSYDPETKKVTIIGAYNKAYTYNLEDFRNEVPLIILEDKDVPLFNMVTFLVFGVAFGASYLTYKGANRLNRTMYPDYKSWLERASSFLPRIKKNTDQLLNTTKTIEVPNN